jgi:hypothetical protein
VLTLFVGSRRVTLAAVEIQDVLIDLISASALCDAIPAGSLTFTQQGLNTHTSAAQGLFGIAISADGAALVTGGSEGTLRRYSTGSMVCEVAMAPRASENEAGLEAGRIFASRTANSRSSVSDPAHSCGHAGSTLSSSPERSLRRAAFGRPAEHCTLRAAVAHEGVHRLMIDHGSVLQIALQPKSRACDAPPPSGDCLQLLASCGSDGLLRLWLAARRLRGRQPALVLLSAVPNLVGRWDVVDAHVRGGAAASPGAEASQRQRWQQQHWRKPRGSSGRRPREGIAARGLCFGLSGHKLFNADIAGRLSRWDVDAMRSGMDSATALGPELHVAAAHGYTRDGRAIASLARDLGRGRAAAPCEPPLHRVHARRPHAARRGARAGVRHLALARRLRASRSRPALRPLASPHLHKRARRRADPLPGHVARRHARRLGRRGWVRPPVDPAPRSARYGRG